MKLTFLDAALYALYTARSTNASLYMPRSTRAPSAALHAPRYTRRAHVPHHVRSAPRAAPDTLAGQSHDIAKYVPHERHDSPLK